MTTKKAQIFLSYAKQDQTKVEKFYEWLRAVGHEPWMDKFNIIPGEDWKQCIKRAIEQCDLFLAFLSSNSVDKRGVLQWEIKHALDLREEKLDRDIYLIPVRLEPVDMPDRLKEIQWVDLFEADGWERLCRAIEAQGFPGINKPPTQVDVRWELVETARRRIFDVTVPSYLLDSTYHFLDWNPTFDELIARPLGLKRSDHALDFIRQLANCNDVVAHSKEAFGPGKDPLVDLEILHLNSEKFGIVLFQKIAALIADGEGNTVAWSVNLNVLVAEKTQELWQAIRARLEREVNWTRYALSYDKLLQPFDDYQALVDLVVGLVGPARRCADLGAGTGNGTLKLLDKDQEREVWAVENNELMLQFLRSKVRFHDEREGCNCWDRLTVVKEDIQRQGELPSNYFDAVVLINVLYTVDEPTACLAEAYRILKNGGVLVLSCPHRDTNVGRLLAQMRKVLEKKGQFDALKINFELAKQVHDKMNTLIHRATRADIRKYIEDAHFKIEEWRDNEYVDAVVVVKAIKDDLA